MKPNVLFLFSDEHGFRYMNHQPQKDGGEPVHTPNFDRLAAQATVFTNAYCQMPLCTPSRMTIFTGLEMRKCGAWGNQAVLRPELPTMGDVLGENGYETCLVGKYHLGGTNQHGGFNHRPYGDLTGKCGHQWEPINDDERKTMRNRTALAGLTTIPESLHQENIVCQESMAFLRDHSSAKPKQPWFLCASFSRPHFPLNAPRRHLDRYWPAGVTEPKVGKTGDAYDHPMSVGMRKGFRTDEIDHEEMMKARAGYFANVTYLDEIIGDFLNRLEAEGLLDNTIVVYSTDHGEMAGEHGVWWKNGWYDGCTRVPFIISTPEQRRGERQAQRLNIPVRLIDLFPTLCGLTGIPVPKGLDGADLSASLTTGAPLPADKPVFCDGLTPRWGKGTEFRMIRLGQYKYVTFRNAPPLMFDMKSDPHEQCNLVGSDDPAVTEARIHFEKLAVETMDFDEAERERTKRDGRLADEYAANLDRDSTLNQFILPDGRLVEGDDTLYNPRILAENAAQVFLGKGR